MKTVRLAVLAGALALAVAAPLWAGDKGKGKGPKVAGVEAKACAKRTGSSASAKEPWIGVKVDISPSEREIIRTYVHACTAAKGRGKKAKGLPPGLAKKVARGGELPPGWQKKCVRGEIMPREVYWQCHRLPREVAVKLPPRPHGTILVTIDGKVVRLARATLEILDVFEVL